MKNKLFILLTAILIAVTFLAKGQTDDQNIQHAKNAVEVTKSCDDALRFLNNVSPEGKMTAPYFLYMGKANDCKLNTEQAIYYYKKYLEFQPANDSVKKRVAELSDEKTQDARVANEQRVAKAAYQSASKHKKKKKIHNCIDDNFMLLGVGYNAALGGANAPFKDGLSFSYSANYSILHDRAILNFSFNTDFLLSPNTSWFSNVFAMPESQVSGVGMGFYEGFQFAPMAVIINKKKLALTAGPTIGLAYFYTPEPSVTYGGAITSDDDADFALSYGVKANLLLGYSTAFYLEYTGFSRKSVTTEFGGVPQSFPVNRDMLRIGICYRMDSWGWW